MMTPKKKPKNIPQKSIVLICIVLGIFLYFHRPVVSGQTSQFLPVSIVVVTINDHRKVYRFDPRANDHRPTQPFERDVPGCKLQGVPIKCSFVRAKSEEAAIMLQADAVSFHANSEFGCWMPNRLKNATHLRVVTATESSTWNNCLDDRNFMAQFDVEMTYRMCSQVPLHYYIADRYSLIQLQATLVPFAEKKNAIAFMTSDCRVEGSGRMAIMHELSRLMQQRGSLLKLHSYGGCLHNKNGQSANKVAIFRNYKFCIAMENSLQKDYITEKVWDALEAGCLPIYFGAPNIHDFLPDSNAAIVFGLKGVRTPSELLDTLERLAANEDEYKSYFAWKSKQLKELSTSFQNLVLRSEVHLPHVQCQLCQLVAQQKIKPLKYTLCPFNKTWLQT